MTRSAGRDLRGLLWPHRWRLVLAFLLLLLGRAGALTLPAASKLMVDEVVQKHRSTLLLPIAGAVVLGTLLQAGTAFALSQLLGVAAQRSIMDMRRQLHEKIMRLPVHYFDQTKTGVLISRIMSDAEALRNFLGTALIELASSVLTAVLALGALLYLDWRLTTTTMAFLGVFGALMVKTFNWVRPLYKDRAEVSAQLTGRLGEALSGIRTIKVYHAERHERRVFVEGLHRLFRSSQREITAGGGVGAAAIVLFGWVAAMMLYAGGRHILSGEMTLGGFVMYVFLVGLLIAPVVRIADTGTQLNGALAGLERIREIHEMIGENDDDRGREPLESVQGDIELRNVSFEYQPGAPVLKDVSLTARAGTTTALVGSSGAGKSTLIGLIMTFHRPTSGAVLVDGRDLAAVRSGDYRRYLGAVLQDNFLFDGTIAENIAYGRPDASRAEIEDAGRVAHCHEFVEALPDKYETLVGERGVKLSGGQRQRISIARALLVRPRILILDEATSSLDSESEALIQDGLRSLRQGRTTFVIAHRLSTVRSADQILVMENGAIVERGTHESLMAADGRYRQLYDKQYRTERNLFVTEPTPILT